MAMKMGMSPSGLPTPPAMLIPRVSLGPLVNSTVLVSWGSAAARKTKCASVGCVSCCRHSLILCANHRFSYCLCWSSVGLGDSRSQSRAGKPSWSRLIHSPFTQTSRFHLSNTSSQYSSILCSDEAVPGCTERAFVQSGRVRP